MNALRQRAVFAVFAVSAVFLAGLGAGCSRAHLTPSHGRAFREVFVAQDANPNRNTVKSVNGLDSQEASIIAGNYRKALSPKADNSGGAGNQLLRLSAQRPVNDSAGLPSSVPGGN